MHDPALVQRREAARDVIDDQPRRRLRHPAPALHVRGQHRAEVRALDILEDHVVVGAAEPAHHVRAVEAAQQRPLALEHLTPSGVGAGEKALDDDLGAVVAPGEKHLGHAAHRDAALDADPIDDRSDRVQPQGYTAAEPASPAPLSTVAVTSRTLPQSIVNPG